MPVPADEALISYVITNDALSEVQRAGINDDDFQGEYRTVWRHLTRMSREHGSVPSKAVLLGRFPDLELPRTRSSDVPMLVSQLKQRRKYNGLLKVLTDAAGNVTDHEAVDGVIQQLQSDLNRLALSDTNGRSEHLVDLKNPKTTKKMLREMRSRRDARYEDAIATGLESFDRRCGGLMRQKMVVIIGRPGLGKSWLDLLFVAQAVMQGKTVILYPLEMSLFDTACRLYTLFTQAMFGPDKVLKNMDLVHGNVNTRRVARMLSLLEDRLPGTLHIADVSKLGDPYTNERIAAEVDLYRPDMFWVDYLTLLKPPGNQGVEDWSAVRTLSNGIKSTAMRFDTVGGCSAQVNRLAVQGNVMIPRLEHISYGDSIGQDADLVFSIARPTKKYLYWSLVKNRGGPEIGKRKVEFNPNDGLFNEVDTSDEASKRTHTRVRGRSGDGDTE